MQQHEPPTRNQTGFGILGIVLVLAVIAVLGASGLVVYQHRKSSAHNTAATSTSQTTTQTQEPPTTPAPPPDPYAGWKLYTSSSEKLSFKYPPDWTTTNYSDRTPTGKADAVELFNPSKSVAVYWDSQIDGIGGACDPSVFPGSAAAKNNSPGACPYFKVLDKKKLTGADLYYVAGIVTYDGTHYSPWMALQDSHGILTSKGDMGYLMFQGKNNSLTYPNGHVLQTTPVKLIGGESSLPPFGEGGVGNLTESQATAFYSTPDAQQIKLILLSASY
jgi:hypothetical protein